MQKYRVRALFQQSTGHVLLCVAWVYAEDIQVHFHELNSVWLRRKGRCKRGVSSPTPFKSQVDLGQMNCNSNGRWWKVGCIFFWGQGSTSVQRGFVHSSLWNANKCTILTWNLCVAADLCASLNVNDHQMQSYGCRATDRLIVSGAVWFCRSCVK